METIFMNTENNKTNEPHRFKLTLADKINLKDPNKNTTLAACNNNKFKFASTWNDKFDLPDRSYYVSDIHDYFEYIIKNMKLKQITLLCKLCEWSQK